LNFNGDLKDPCFSKHFIVKIPPSRNLFNLSGKLNFEQATTISKEAINIF
jgi:hypothetical protein